MPYLFKDLIVTLIPRGGLGPLVAADGGGTAGGGCTTSCGGIDDFECGDSGEIIEVGPYAAIDPAFQLELRQLLLYGLTASAVPVTEPTSLEVLTEQMRPQTVEEVESIEKRLTEALRELGNYKKTLRQSD
jgi:hypothetical protein